MKLRPRLCLYATTSVWLLCVLTCLVLELSKKEDLEVVTQLTREEDLEVVTRAPSVSYISDKCEDPPCFILQFARKALLGEGVESLEPLNVIIVTTWRSGSTFLEEMLGAAAGAWEVYEPLMTWGTKRLLGGEDADQAIEMIRSILECDYKTSDVEKLYLDFAEERMEMVARNRRWWEACHWSNDPAWLRRTTPRWCLVRELLGAVCSMHPVKVVKVVRLGLEAALPLLDVPRTRIVHLVRDPRAVMASRAKLNWCDGECKDVQVTCDQMEEDRRLLQSLQEDRRALKLHYEKLDEDRLILSSLMTSLKSDIIHVRYEDLAMDPHTVAGDIVRMLGLVYPHNNLRHFIDAHNKNTNITKESYATFRRSKDRISAWRTQLPSSDIELINSKCQSTIDYYNYN